MFQINRRAFLGSLACAAGAGPVFAQARAYRIKPGGAEITFRFTLEGTEYRGSAPLVSADLRLDPRNLTRSEATVTADLRRVKTGLIFATEALKAQSLLDVNRFPEARFQSTNVILGPNGQLSNGAALEGRLTLKGTTRPIRFAANLYRAPGTARDDLRNLTVHLAGHISRKAFGITGYPKLAEDRVGLDIRAEIQSVG